MAPTEPWPTDDDLYPLTFTGGPLIVAEDDNTENAVERRLERVCEDLSAGRVVPRQVDRLNEAVKRTQLNQNLHRAIRK
jgi:hypothetical protein